MDKSKKRVKHLHVIISEDLRILLKRRALDRNVSVSKYVLDAIMARIRAESQYT